MAFVEIAEARQIKRAGLAVVERARLADQILNQPGDVRTHDVFAEVVTHVPAGIADAVWVSVGLRKKDQPRGFQSRSGDHDDLRFRLVVSARLGINERHAARLAGLLVDGHFVGNRVGPERQVTGVHCWHDQAGWRIEGADIAAACSSITRAATETLAAILVML